MFSVKKKKEVKPYDFMRFISETTSPNFYWSDDIRSENRYNRTIPVIITPWEDGEPCADPITIAITKDISEEGACLISNEPRELAEIVIGFWIDAEKMPEPWFFHAAIIACFEIGGGFWQIGTKIDELLDSIPSKVQKPLIVNAARLLPPKKLESAPPMAPVERAILQKRR